jgi:hypothetical protein
MMGASHDIMVKRQSGFGLGLALSVLGLISCGRFEKPPADTIHRNEVETALLNLSADMLPILSSGSVTSIFQLRLEWSRQFPQTPPLFTTSEPG